MLQKLKSNRKVADFLFILWAGGAALLSYSLVYTLRKPYTAAVFDDLSFFGIDYKVAVTTIQVLGYLLSKFIGIKLISEMKRALRFRFFVGSVILAEAALLFFGLLPSPYNALAMFVNGLALGCMWGIIFSFIEGRRVTDILASLLGVSMVFSSGLAKSVGLFVMNDLHVSPFWMPALVGGVAFPFLLFTGYLLKVLPKPTSEDIACRSERVALDGRERKALFLKYCPILSLLFVANLLLLMLRDIKEDFLVNIIDMSQHSSWLFAQIDTIVTLVILALFSLFTFFRSNIKVLMMLLILVVLGCGTMSYVSAHYDTLNLDTITWLFVQSLSLYIAYLTFQTIFFDRFIACFRIKGNVGFFIAIIDFIGYMGTVVLLFSKELFKVDIEWFAFYNHLAFAVGTACLVLFAIMAFLLVRAYKRQVEGSDDGSDKEAALDNTLYNAI